MNATEYREAATSYAAHLRGLFAPTGEIAPEETITRGADVGIPPEILVERTDGLVDASERLGVASAGLLHGDDRALREAAELKLLTQATAELEVAQALLLAASEEEAEAGAVTRGVATRRGAGGPAVQESLGRLAGALEVSIEEEVATITEERRVTRSGPASLDLATARRRLQDESANSLRYITDRASFVGGRALSDLALVDMAAIREGASLLGKKVDDVVQKVTGTLRGVLAKLARAALRLLLSAYRWVMSLFGKDVDESGWERLDEWLSQLGRGGSSGGDGKTVLGTMIEQLYRSETIGREIETWLQSSSAEGEAVGAAADEARALGDRFRAKMDKVESLLKAVALAKKVPLLKAPMAQAVIIGVTVGLLGYTVYAGYDHIDSDRLPWIPDRVEGVRQTVQGALGLREGS